MTTKERLLTLLDSTRNRMSAQTDILSSYGIKQYLSPVNSKLTIDVLDSVTSTNTLVKEKGNCGVSDGYVLVSGSQTAGRGRTGKKFFSPDATGVYMSILLRPENCTPQHAVRLTTIAAVSVCEAIEAVAGVSPQIKWVNDVYLHGRKICGILTEASLGPETGLLEYAVLGVGINIYSPETGFPEELQQIAGSVFETRHADAKNQIAGEFLNSFLNYYRAFDKPDYISEYRRRNLVIGKKIHVIRQSESDAATALDIDENCRLLVRYDSGIEEYLSSGEISIKL